MLLNIGHGTESGGFIVVEDTVKYSGREILKCFINAAIKRGEDVHVLGFETSEAELRAGLDSSSGQKLVKLDSSPFIHLTIFLPQKGFIFHKGHPDPLGWTCKSSVTVQQFNTPDITRLVQNTPHTKAAVLIVDSLSFILRHHQPVVICRSLQELKKVGVVKTIVGLLHSDLHLQGVVKSVCHLANAVISVAPANNEHCGVAKTTRRTKSGKLMQEEEYFDVSEDAALSVKTRTHQPGHVQTEPDKPKEKEAKEKVALPFVFSQEKKSALLRPTPGTGRITYEPDAYDDFDEEDPDDDLDV